MILDALAVARLTRLVVEDAITEPLRARAIVWAYGGEREFTRARARLNITPSCHEHDDVVAEDDCPPKIATLVTCPWCSGIWLAAGVVLVSRTRAWRPVRDLLAVAELAMGIRRMVEG